MTPLISQRGNEVLLVDGYKFTFDKPLIAGFKRWKCGDRSCKCSLKTSADYGVVEVRNEHNHRACSEKQINRLKFVSELRKTLMSANLDDTPTEILQKHLSDESLELVGLTSHDIESLRKCVQRARRTMIQKLAALSGDQKS